MTREHTKPVPIAEAGKPIDEGCSAFGQSYVPPKDAAGILHVHHTTLARWRVTGEGPAFRRMGKRCIRYAIADLEAFMGRPYRSTSED